MRGMTITRRIVVGFVVLLVLMILSGAFAIYTLFSVTGQMKDQRNQQAVVTAAVSQLKFDLNAEVDALRAELLAKSQGGASLTDITTVQHAVGADLKQVRQLVAGDKASADSFAALQKLAQQFDTAAAKVLTLARANQVKEATSVNEQEVNPLSILITRSLDELLKAVDAKVANDQRSIDHKVKTMGYAAIAVLAVALLIGLILVVVIPRQVSRQLKDIITRLSTSTAEMLAVTSQVAAGAVQTATAISEAATTVDEVRQTSLLSSQKATAVSDSAQAADQVAESGRRAVTETLEGIRRIQDQMAVVADSVVRLSEQTEAVGEIIATSNDLAEQSNLLSVNAAIEAAKASEQGKGFSVVAEEIKSLAQQSKQGVIQVRSILNDIQKATSAAVMAAEQSGKSIEEGAQQALESSQAIESLAESVAAAAQSAMQIVASSQQQLVGMDQISEAMASIDQASAQNASGARQMEAEVQHLQELAVQLRAMIDARYRAQAGAERGFELAPESV